MCHLGWPGQAETPALGSPDERRPPQPEVVTGLAITTSVAHHEQLVDQPMVMVMIDNA